MAAVTFDAFYRYAQTRNLSGLDVVVEEQGSGNQSGRVKIDGERWQSGVFRFPDEILGELGIYSSEQSAGRCGFRLDPPWSTGLNPQAARTQVQQAAFFEELTQP